jgi:hypothetical protein
VKAQKSTSIYTGTVVEVEERMHEPREASPSRCARDDGLRGSLRKMHEYALPDPDPQAVQLRAVLVVPGW